LKVVFFWDSTNTTITRTLSNNLSSQPLNQPINMTSSATNNQVSVTMNINVPPTVSGMKKPLVGYTKKGKPDMRLKINKDNARLKKLAKKSKNTEPKEKGPKEKKGGAAKKTPQNSIARETDSASRDCVDHHEKLMNGEVSGMGEGHVCECFNQEQKEELSATWGATPDASSQIADFPRREHVAHDVGFGDIGGARWGRRGTWTDSTTGRPIESIDKFAARMRKEAPGDGDRRQSADDVWGCVSMW
jgi:hypothetical protein